jgi:hypothetical protein
VPSLVLCPPTIKKKKKHKNVKTYGDFDVFLTTLIFALHPNNSLTEQEATEGPEKTQEAQENITLNYLFK